MTITMNITTTCNVDVLSVICKFMTPLDLCRFRKLNRYFYKCVSSFLIQEFQTVCLEDRACPMCGDWISKQNLNDYDEFFNVHPSYADNLLNWINHTVFEHMSSKRCALLCEDCEYDEKELTEKHSNRFFQKMIPFAGTREYNMVMCQSFAIIYRLSSHDEVIWNELRAIIDPTLFHSDNVYNDI